MIVIDTHIWIWWTHDIERLNKVQLEALKANETTTIGVNAISCWESRWLQPVGNAFGDK